MTGENERNDHDALLRAIGENRDLDALERLYRGLRVSVFAVALAVTRDAAAAEDVLQDAFVRVWERASTYSPGTNGRAWVLALARNLAIDRIRRSSRELPTERLSRSEEEGAQRLNWTEALLALDRVEREIVALHVIGGLTHAEIAAQLDVPPATVRWKYQQALRRLVPHVMEVCDER